MTFEEEFKRPVIGPVTELNNIMQAVFRQYRAHREYTSELEKSNKGLKEKVLELENENSLLKDKNNQFDSYSTVMEPIFKPLPAIPQFVAEFIESYKDRRTIYGVFDKISKNRKTYPKLYEWVFEDENSQATFALAFITGKYEVKKPQLFYLREKNTGYYLRKKGNGVYGIAPHYSYDFDEKYMTYTFTQQEIDSMETGSYEQIEVEE